LRSIRALDGVASKKQISEEVIRDMGLPPEVVSELRENGRDTRLDTRLTMALGYLKSYGAIDNPRRGTWVLTPQGQSEERVVPLEVSRAYHRMRQDQPDPMDEAEEETDDGEEIPEEDRDGDDALDVEDRRPRESLEIQALVARVGKALGMDIWIPPNDRSRISQANRDDSVACLETLPLNYGDEPLRTIEQIDVIWIKGSYIERAFEVEHTTAIYSGILRMADLLALIPNMSVKMHIVAPGYRREQVFREILRPVFRYLPPGPLANYCTYISYDNFRELSVSPGLRFMRANVVDSYAEAAS